MAPGPPSRADGPLIPLEEPGWERGGQGGADARLRRPGRTRAPSLGPPDGAEPTRRSPLRVRRFLTRRLRIDASACFPGERERKRKKTFIETLQPAAAEKGDRLRELPPPPLEPLAAGSATPAGGRGGGGAWKAGRGIPGKPPPRGGGPPPQGPRFWGGERAAGEVMRPHGGEVRQCLSTATRRRNLTGSAPSSFNIPPPAQKLWLKLSK